jgi:formiminotetrahydrofolate cyclodeaminase
MNSADVLDLQVFHANLIYLFLCVLRDSSELSAQVVHNKIRRKHPVLVDHKITEYLEKAAAGTAVPGGGSVAALNAALAAGLTEMVANLTVGKKGYETVEEEMIALAEKASQLRKKLTVAIDQDADAYTAVMAAYKLPRATDEETAVRKQKIQDAIKHAALVPLEVARDALAVIELSGQAIRKGNKNAASDGAVAAMNARTAALAAIYNVKINLSSIDDDRFVDKLAHEVRELETQVGKKENEALWYVKI